MPQVGGNARAGEPVKKEPGPLEMLFAAAIYALIAWALFAMGSCTVREWNRTSERVAKREAEEAARLAAMPAALPATAAPAGPSTDVSDVAVLAGAQMAIKSRAFDPESVRFRNLSVHRQDSGSKAVCGEFNAKNRAGGYNGFEPFISAGVAEHTWTRDDVADFDSAWGSLCRG